MISYLLPTRNRPDRLAATLEALGNLSIAAHEAVGGAEVVVVDDASSPAVKLDPALRNGMPLRVIRRAQQEGAAARNAGVREASGRWIVMLDDDSYPVDEAVVSVVSEAAEDIAAIGAEIVLPGGRHEVGGLPEVFIGCGVAVRRDVFLQVGGYDASFDYYAEEYDLCARLLSAGWRVVHDWRWRVRHERDPVGRDANAILRRLVRNNGLVMQRYAPPAHRQSALEEVICRYRAIARKENALAGYQRGLDELRAMRAEQPERPMNEALWERFTGLMHVRATLADESAMKGARIAVVDEGKNACVVRRVLEELTGREVVPAREAEAWVIGSLSPGPMMDAWERRACANPMVFRPWRVPGACTPAPESGGLGAAAGS
jgi:hypothetical protein